MGIPHGIFNKTDRTVKCLFWVAPARRLYDLFWAIHNMKPSRRRRRSWRWRPSMRSRFLPPPMGERRNEWGCAMKVIIAGAGIGGLTPP